MFTTTKKLPPIPIFNESTVHKQLILTCVFSCPTIQVRIKVMKCEAWNERNNYNT